ncbi:GNAT family N-acetyltransferase [uncultured Jatrophihabitans sp.]|uniref:GNAT family N-acetyltransferase n=1 Tax=uncultured Jatrophihabitans sp. TaxID=1610747 RepID=UPI0035C9691A
MNQPLAIEPGPPAGRPDVSVLDNAAWHALRGAHERLAEVHGRARRYRSEFARYSALSDERDEQAWRDLARLAGPGAEVVLTGAPVEPPADWIVVKVGHAVQMAAEGVDDAPDDEASVLGPADVPQIVELIERTRPGPWRPRTIQMGTYLGIRHRGRLIAMAGERVHPPGWTEVSAVCTDVGYRGRGLASRLVRAVVHNIRNRGEEAFLHAAATNTNAIRLYDELGFRLRRETVFAQLLAPGA